MNRINELPGAALNVYRPNSVWQHYYEQLRVDSRTPFVAPDAPFGRSALRHWLEVVLAGLKLPFDERIWREYTAGQDEAWQRVTAKAAQHRLGFVVRGEENHYLTDPAQTWGIPLIAMLEEAGFGLDVMISVGDLKSGRRAVSQVEAVFKKYEPGKTRYEDTTEDANTEPDQITIKGFQNFDALRKLLVRSPCEAVLSHHFFDWRLTEAGKNRFSLQLFEMGLPGAIRTIERLVGVCEIPFFRKYYKFFRRTQEGLRL
jgi:hypothetical protein